MTKNALSISKRNERAWSQTQEIAHSKTVVVDLTRQSAMFGAIIGEIAGALIGIATGALTMNLTAILMGFTAGILLGALTGSVIGIVVARLAGTSGGPSIGAFAGMGLGALLGTAFGLLIPDSIRMSAGTLQITLLNVITASRFETVSFFAFLLCILGAVVGVWVSGKNYRPEKKIG